MRMILVFFIAALHIMSCQKNNALKETVEQDDLAAASAMTSELAGMQQSLNNLVAAPNPAQRLFWDSAYHHHDSLFWHHHNNYHHHEYVHDDHGHEWVPYDPAVNHNHHHHHPYPGHLNDSLIITSIDHHHTNCDHHPGHHICHHHSMDSIHLVHNLHHP